MHSYLMDVANRLLGLLYDSRDRFVTVDELVRRLEIDRAALELRLEALGQRGHRWEHHPERGVRLVRPIRLEAYLIERDLAVRRLGRHVICFDEVDSTNDVAFKAARQARSDGLIVLAERQRRGRGRQGRTWLTPSGANIFLSGLLVVPDDELGHEPLTIAAGLATAQAVEDACALRCELKWPNDVQREGAKVAGVLVEVRKVVDRRAVVIGVGINVASAPAPDQTDEPATCLAKHVETPVERIEMVRALILRLDGWIDAIAKGQTSELHDAWTARCGMLNQRVSVLCGRDRHVGRVLDVSPLEGLVLLRDDGREVHLPAATSTVLSCGGP